MTTLRTFQNEIEDIHHREISKQRAQALQEKEKEQQKHSKGKAKEKDDVPATPAQNDIAAGRSEEVEERILVRRRSSDATRSYIEHPPKMYRIYCYLRTRATMIWRAT